MPQDFTFLPGELWLQRGNWRDYRTLARFHYRPKDPATWSQIWTARYRAPGASPRVVGVAVLSYPTRHAAGRRRAIGIHLPPGKDLRFVNRHIRSISRVIVHPQFRALGLSTRLVQCVCEHCNTKYVEALAVMGRAHPLFEKAGMRRYEPEAPRAPVYFLYERRAETRYRNPNDVTGMTND